MYIPKHFKMQDIKTIVSFIEQHSFGILISANNKNIQGTHLPFLIEEKDGKVKLISHMSRKNKQWHEIEDEVMIVFYGPDAYISPSWYEEDFIPPTWNYQAVHVYGKFIPQDTSESLDKIMERTIKNFEENRNDPWHGNVSENIYNKLIKGVVGFEIEVTDIQGQWKLHQNHPDKQADVIKALHKSNKSEDIELANTMDDLNKKI